MSFDLNILRFISENFQNPILDKVMVVVTYLGEGGFIWFLASILLLLFKKTRKVGIISLASLILCTLLNEVVIKNIIQRARPFVNNDFIKLIIKKPNSYSFPSGHTAMSFAAVGIWVRFVEKMYYKLGLVIAAIIMSFSRLYLMVHYPTDVLGGIVVGLFSSYAVYNYFKCKDKKNKE